MILTIEVLKQRGYEYDFDLDRNDQPCHSYHKNGVMVRDVFGNGEAFEVNGEAIETTLELAAFEKTFSE